MPIQGSLQTYPTLSPYCRVKVLRMGDAVLSEECLNEASGQMPELQCWVVSGAILGVSNTVSQAPCCPASFAVWPQGGRLPHC